jgi:hypothetical protein
MKTSLSLIAATALLIGSAALGYAQRGSAPSGANQQGSTPSAATQQGSTPSAATQQGSTPSAATQQGSTPSAATQEGSTSSGATQEGNTASGSAQQGSNSSQQGGAVGSGVIIAPGNGTNRVERDHIRSDRSRDDLTTGRADRGGCTTQTYVVPSEETGDKKSVGVVRC